MSIEANKLFEQQLLKALAKRATETNASKKALLTKRIKLLKQKIEYFKEIV